MNDETFEKYLTDRYEDQRKWYSRESRRNKKMYVRIQTTVIALAAVTPALAGAGLANGGELAWVALLTAACSLVVAIGTSLLKTFKYQENWRNYRTTSESLKKEMFQYETRTGDYADARDPREVFVERVELLISRENTFWLSVQRKKEKPKDQT